MAYSHTNSKGSTYYLHENIRELKGGKKISLYYFGKEVNAPKALDALPDGYKVVESEKTGLPMLKKS